MIYVYLYRRHKDNIRITVLRCCSSEAVELLEHVVVDLTYEIDKNMEHGMDIIICSPALTCSFLLRHENSTPSANAQEIVKRRWPFMSVQFWDETPSGEWTLKIVNRVKETKFCK